MKGRMNNINLIENTSKHVSASMTTCFLYESSEI